MPLKSRAALAALWVTGYVPAEQDYTDWRDSFWHKDDTLPNQDDMTPAEIVAAFTQNVPLVSGAEIAAGTNTAIRQFSPANIVDMIEAHETTSGAQVDELVFVTNFVDLPAGVSDKLYIVRSTGRGIYFWDGNDYVSLTSGGGSGSAAGVTYTTLTASGVNLSVGYHGPNAPTLSGSAGNYTLTFVSGSAPQSLYLEATDGAAATSSNNIAFSVVGERRYHFATEVTDLLDGAVVRSRPGLTLTRQGNGSGQVTLTANGIASVTTGFGLKFSF